jgi:hypothetical protein
MSDIPMAVWEGSFRLFGVDVKCSVLADGRRLIDAERFARLVEAMQSPDGGVEFGDVSGFNRWRLGVDA